MTRSTDQPSGRETDLPSGGDLDPRSGGGADPPSGGDFDPRSGADPDHSSGPRSDRPSNLRIREATLADLPIVLRHRRRMFNEMGERDQERLDLAMSLSESFFAQGLADGTYRSWFMIDDSGAVVAGAGLVLLHYHPGPRDPKERRPVVVNVYTEPGFRRLGLARCLMQAIIEWCRGCGYRCIYLHASADGRPLYESIGFTPTNEMRLDLE